MLLQIAFTTILILGVYFYFSFIFLVKKKLKWYKDTLEGLGYTVRQMEFHPFSIGVYGEWVECQKTKGDSLWAMKNQTPKYDICLYNIMNNVAIDFINPDLLKGFFSPEKVDIYPKVSALTANIRRILGEGVGFSQGKQWRRKRKTITAVFNYDFLTGCIPKISKICDEQFDSIEKQYRETHPEQGKEKASAYICDVFSQIFSTVMVQCFFGSGFTGEKINGQKFSTFLIGLLNDMGLQGRQAGGFLLGAWIYNLGLTEIDRSINRRVKLLRKMGRQFIHQRVEQLSKTEPKEKYTDIVEALMKYNMMTEKKNKEQDHYDFDELIDQFCTFLVAGTDTTAHLTMMIIYYVKLCPGIEEKLRKEVNEHIHSDEDITIQNLKKLKYIDWLQNQATRIYGPGVGMFFREASKDHYISNIPIKKGTYLAFEPTGNHFNPKYFPDPFQFKPERWAEKEVQKLHPFAFVGFSAGPRHCIGKQLALLQSKISLIKFIRRYPKCTIPLKDVSEMKMRVGFLYQPQIMNTDMYFADPSV